MWGASGAEVAHGRPAAVTPLLLLLKGLQGWRGQQNPSHSLFVLQSLLWTVAAPQLGSPLVWKSSLSLAHPWLILQFCPRKCHLPKVHRRTPAEPFVQS